ncbi:MAG TPA: type II CAAX endopeptidase family protein [Candidatus Kapabacteria bacterium]|nr:type II CAAX endopeptidase family protein [Candidatus Kapabacteria bacterium]
MEKKSLLMFSLSIFSALLILYFISMLALFLDKRPSEELNFYLIIVMQILVFLSPIAFVSVFFKKNVKEIINLNINFNYRFIIYAVAGLFFLDIVNNSILSFQDYLVPVAFKDVLELSKQNTQGYYSQLLMVDRWYMIIVPIFIGAILPAICEEMFFRGLLQKSLSKYSKWIMVLVPSIIFGFFHGQIVFLLPLILVGIYLALLSYYAQSIVPSIIIHFINNLKSIVLMNLFGADTQSMSILYASILFPISLFLLYYTITLIKRFIVLPQFRA